jgi:hypothetical protein
MLRTIFSVRGKKPSAEVIPVYPLDTIFPTWRAKLAYHVTISSRHFLAYPDEETCIERAKEEVQRE